MKKNIFLIFVLLLTQLNSVSCNIFELRDLEYLIIGTIVNRTCKPNLIDTFDKIITSKALNCNEKMMAFALFKLHETAPVIQEVMEETRALHKNKFDYLDTLYSLMIHNKDVVPMNSCN